ncbi:Early nodulin-like protein 3, partial [Linum perenne]
GSHHLPIHSPFNQHCNFNPSPSTALENHQCTLPLNLTFFSSSSYSIFSNHKINISIQLGSFLTQPLTQLVLLFSSMAASSRTSILVLNYYSQAAAKELLLGGNTNAWTVPTSDSLNKWAQNTCFRIDDSLVWKYDGTEHYPNS